MFRFTLVLAGIIQFVLPSYGLTPLNVPTRGGIGRSVNVSSKQLKAPEVSRVLGHEPGSYNYFLNDEYYSIPGSGGATPFRVLSINSNVDLHSRSFYFLDPAAYSPGMTSGELKYAYGSFSSNNSKEIELWSAKRLSRGDVRMTFTGSHHPHEVSVILRPYSTKFRILLAEPTQVDAFTTVEISTYGGVILRRVTTGLNKKMKRVVVSSTVEPINPSMRRSIVDIFGTDF
jgi:hypothetical protein